MTLAIVLEIALKSALIAGAALGQVGAAALIGDRHFETVQRTSCLGIINELRKGDDMRRIATDDADSQDSVLSVRCRAPN